MLFFVQQFMIIDKKSFVFEDEFSEILFFSLTKYKTLVAIGRNPLTLDSIIVHINETGKTLFRQIFKQTIKYAELIGGTTVIMPVVSLGSIYVVNLLFNKGSCIKFNFITYDSSNIKMHYYPQTDFICLTEYILNRNSKLTYANVSIPLLSTGKLEIKTVWEEQQYHFCEFVNNKKGNSHSMVLWIIFNANQKFQLKTFDLQDSLQGKLRIYLISMIQQPWKNTYLFIEAWQAKRNKFVIIYKQNTEISKQIIQIKLWDVENNSLHNVAQKLSLSGNASIYSAGQNTIIQIQMLYKLGMINHKFIFSNSQEKIIKHEKSSRQQPKMSILSKTPRFIYQGKHPKNSKKIFNVVVTWNADHTLNLFHLLFASMPFLDDDLLVDAVSLIK